MPTIDEEILAEAEAQLAEDRRRAGRMEFDNQYLVQLVRQPEAPKPGDLHESAFMPEPARPARSRLGETVLAALAFWALAFWLLKMCVG